MRMRYYCMGCTCDTTIEYIPGTIDDDRRGMIEVRCPTCGNGMGHFEWHNGEYRYYPKSGMFYTLDGSNVWVCP